MGPNPLWLAESLLEVMRLPTGARVLDLGCGKALSSMFVAQEAGVQVWADDLWIKATDNLARIEAAGLADQVFPIDAEAHALPYADGFFDAILSLDAYHYFGTDEAYLAGYLLRFLRPGGQIGIVVPGLTSELEEVPDHLAGWLSLSSGFHSPGWWRQHWSRTAAVNVETADLLPDGWRLWMDWCRICASLPLARLFPEDDGGVAEGNALERDAGRTMGFSRIVARKL